MILHGASDTHFCLDMELIVSKQNIFFSTLNATLFLAEPAVLPLFNQELLPVDNHTAVILFRAVTVLVACVAIGLNIEKKARLSTVPKVLWVFWALLIIRLLLDCLFNNEFKVDSHETTNMFVIIFAFTLLPMFSLTISYNNIDIGRAFRWVYPIYAFTIFLLFFVQGDQFQTASEGRAEDSINIGYVGLVALIFSLYTIFRKEYNLLWKVLSAFISIASVLVFLRSGSRGVLLAAIGVWAFFILTKMKRNIKSLIIVGAVCTVLYFLFDKIVEIVIQIAPILGTRMMMDHAGGQFDTRIDIYKYALDAFRDSPIWGKCFAIYKEGSFGYSHNSVIDALMQWGIIGGIMLVYIYLKSIIHGLHLAEKKSNYTWVAYLMLIFIFKTMVSSAFYLEGIISFSIIILFAGLQNNNNVTQKTNNKYYRQ